MNNKQTGSGQQKSFPMCKPEVNLSAKPREYRKGSVPYSDFVTILPRASMQYITKLAMSQSQQPPVPQNIM